MYARECEVQLESVRYKNCHKTYARECELSYTVQQFWGNCHHYSILNYFLLVINLTLLSRYSRCPSTVWLSHWCCSPHPGGHHHRLHRDTSHQGCLSCQQILLPGDGDSCLWSPWILVPHLGSISLPFLL